MHTNIIRMGDVWSIALLYLGDMKKLLFFTALLLFTSISIAQVGIGTESPHASSILEVKSDSLGMLIPRITTANRIAISSPANGLMVYDLTTKSFWGFANKTWYEFLSDASIDPSFRIGTTSSRALSGGLYANIHYYDQPFDTTPVVVHTLDLSITDNGATWSRLENIPSSNRFDIRTNNSVDQLNFFAIPPGEYTISNKTFMAGREENINGLTTIEFPDEFEEAPIVIISMEVPSTGISATAIRLTDSDVAEFEVWTNAPSNIQWIAMDVGEYNLNGWKWYAGEADLGAGSFQTITYPMTFDTKYQSPIILASLYDTNNNGPIWGRISNVTNTDFEFRLGGSGLEKLHWVGFVKN
ncbi:MAG: hypothetical protein AAGA77_14350 [Bacteroidota bacterium]